MSCGCNKNKQNGPEFRQEPTPQTSIFKKIGMVQSFASALASRGISDNKIPQSGKQLRVLSCFGNQNTGGELTPCQHLKESSTPGKHFCGGCGCGDKPHTWLMADEQTYSKLDYPKLNCPLNMPGFTNYKPSNPDEANEPISRKYYIENIDYAQIASISVSTPEKQPEPPQS
jgi:hypothetical protein